MKPVSGKSDPSEAVKNSLSRLQDERIAHLIRLCARGFSRSLSRRLSGYDISFGQWVFLRILWKEEGLAQRQLSERANLTEPTVHTALTKMEQKGLIHRRHKKGDRRTQYVYLSKRGRELRLVLEPLAVDVNDIALAGLDKTQQEILHRILIHSLSNLEADESEAEARGQRIPPTRGFAV